MAETTADVRRDIELTRNRMSDTLAQLEQKMNLMQVVKDHPWPALAVAVAAGALLAGSKSDVKAAAAAAGATKGASSKVGDLLDDAVASLVGGAHAAFQSRLEGWVSELKEAIGAPTNNNRQGSDSFHSGSAGFQTGNVGNQFGASGATGSSSPSTQRGYDGLSAATAGTLGAGDSSQLGRAD
jgi:hypothetical protein